MKTTPAREERKAKTREQILDAARELLLADGFHGFSMRKLAAKVHYTATAIYFHFPDKDALLGELVDREFIRFRQIFDRTSKIPDPIARLEKMGLQFVDFAIAQPDVYKILFMNTQVEAFPRVGLIERGNPAQDCYAYLRTTIAEAIAAGRFRHELNDPDLLSQIFMSGTHGIVSLHIARGKDPWVSWRPVKKRARLLIEGLIRGLTMTEPQASSPAPGLPADFVEDLT
jgi:AcrR family transcriptional regulator